MSFILTRATEPNVLFAEQLPELMAFAANEFATLLFDEVARGPRSGPVYEEYGSLYPASVPGEPEQEQSGNLRRSVGSYPVDDPALAHAWAFGFGVNEVVEQEKLYALELDDEDPRYRGTLERLALDPNAQDFVTTQIVLALE